MLSVITLLKKTVSCTGIPGNNLSKVFTKAKEAVEMRMYKIPFEITQGESRKNREIREERQKTPRQETQGQKTQDKKTKD